MKKLILALLLIPSLCLGAANDLLMNQRNSVDDGQQPRLITVPAGGADGVLGYNGADQRPKFLGIGTGLSLTAGVLSATATGSASWASITGTPTTLSGYGITDGVTLSALSAYATTTALTSGLATKFNTPTGTASQYIRGDGSLATLPAASTPSQAAATRTLNTIYQVSATRGAWATYSVQLQVTATIAGGQNGDVILEIASDSAFTANVQTLSISGLGQTYSVAVAIQGVQPQTGVVSGFIPAGYYARLRTVNNTGTPTFTYRAGQETLM